MPFCPPELGGGNRILDVDFSTETFQTRLLLWKQAIKIFQERPILGWGPENFSAAFEKHYLPQFEVWYDRAHNIFFDYLAETGILGLLSYLSIFVVYYWQFFVKNPKSQILNPKQIQNSKFKTQNTISNALLFALPIAYLVQGLVLFEVLPIYINLFLLLAFVTHKLNNFKF
jgi:O-antigen ligase